MPHLDRFDFGALRVAHTETYEVDANWKFIAENYSECYHCPGIHPQLNKLTPYDLGGDFAPDGPWQGGWMELVDDAETMALDGGHRAGRPAMAGITDARRPADLLLPALAVDLPLDPSGLPARPPARARRPRATRGSCATGCSSRRPSRPPGFDPSDAIGFWDLTNRQDWHVCELQQRGTRSRSWVAGRYSNQEPSVHAFDLMCVDRYADDGVGSRRTVRSALRRPATEGRPDGGSDGPGDVPATLLPRSTATGPGRGRRPAADQRLRRCAPVQAVAARRHRRRHRHQPHRDRAHGDAHAPRPR